jgi:hypothetical protein
MHLNDSKHTQLRITITVVFAALLLSALATEAIGMALAFYGAGGGCRRRIRLRSISGNR